MTTSEGLVRTLLVSGAAEKSRDQIRFTNRFIAHMALYGEYIRTRGGAVSLWRDVFCIFDSRLHLLDDEEIKTVIMLLDYYLQIVETNHDK